MANKQHTPEEKAFNAAQCSICLLDWPMAQCLACKFHQPEVEKDFDPKTMEIHTMNGYTPSLDVVTRIYNLIEQIPAEYRKDAESECFSTGMSDHEYERNLTGYVMRKGWITTEQRKQAAESAEIDNWIGMFETLPAMVDPRTDEQIALDIFQSETEATRESELKGLRS